MDQHFYSVWTLITILGIFPHSHANKSTSVNESAVSPRLLYGETHGVSWTDLALDHHLPPLVSRVFLDVRGLDYHYHHHWLFFSGLGQIWRLSMDQERAEPEVIVQEAGEATGVAVDWVEDRIYWLSPATKTVRKADLTGGKQEVFLEDVRNISRLGNIVIDPYCRMMFVTLNMKGAGVLRAGLKETTRTRATVQLKGERLQEVVSMALDVHHRRLFLSAREDYLPTIISCAYDGSSLRRYDLSDIWWNQVPAIGVLGEWMFWVHHDWPGSGPGGDVVWKTNSTKEGEIKWTKEYKAQGKFLDPNPRIWALKVYHPEAQSPPTDLKGGETSPDGMCLNFNTSSPTNKQGLL